MNSIYSFLNSTRSAVVIERTSSVILENLTQTTNKTLEDNGPSYCTLLGMGAALSLIVFAFRKWGQESTAVKGQNTGKDILNESEISRMVP